jgi:predicted NodU family carbamoyl transferase
MKTVAPLQEPLYSERFVSRLNNKPHRLEDMPIDGYYKDIAKSAQEHLEKVALNLLEYLHEKTRSQNLCLA